MDGEYWEVLSFVVAGTGTGGVFQEEEGVVIALADEAESLNYGVKGVGAATVTIDEAGLNFGDILEDFPGNFVFQKAGTPPGRGAGGFAECVKSLTVNGPANGVEAKAFVGDEDFEVVALFVCAYKGFAFLVAIVAFEAYGDFSQWYGQCVEWPEDGGEEDDGGKEGDPGKEVKDGMFASQGFRAGSMTG